MLPNKSTATPVGEHSVVGPGNSLPPLHSIPVKSAWPHTKSADVSGKPDAALCRYSSTRLFAESAAKRSSPASVAICCGDLSPAAPPPAVPVLRSGCPITSSAVTSPAPGSPLEPFSGVLNITTRLLRLSDTYRLFLLSSASRSGLHNATLLAPHAPALEKLVPVLSTPKASAAVFDANPLPYGYSSTRLLPESAIYMLCPESNATAVGLFSELALIPPWLGFPPVKSVP